MISARRGVALALAAFAAAGCHHRARPAMNTAMACDTVPADPATRDARCEEVYRIQVQGLVTRMRATGTIIMTKSEPEAELWRNLFTSLTGNATVDAATIREFCDLHDVTPAQVLAEMHAHRRTTQHEE